MRYEVCAPVSERERGRERIEKGENEERVERKEREESKE